MDRQFNKRRNKMKCSICKEKITADPNGWEGGCNAQPINNGICCYKCDEEVVLPRRLSDVGINTNSAHLLIPKFPTNLIKEIK
jgi:hypothetical protein